MEDSGDGPLPVRLTPEFGVDQGEGSAEGGVPGSDEDLEGGDEVQIVHFLLLGAFNALGRLPR